MKYRWLKIDWPYHLTGSGWRVKKHRIMTTRPSLTEEHPGPFWDCPDPKCPGPYQDRDWRAKYQA